MSESIVLRGLDPERTYLLTCESGQWAAIPAVVRGQRIADLGAHPIVGEPCERPPVPAKLPNRPYRHPLGER